MAVHDVARPGPTGARGKTERTVPGISHFRTIISFGRMSVLTPCSQMPILGGDENEISMRKNLERKKSPTCEEVLV